MAKNLLIVESPAKAKTIEKYLGKDFKVKSSYGHIRDLDKGEKGLDVETLEPKYTISPEKRKVVKELKDEAKKAEEIWLATDEDREGEAISWHLCEVLGLNPAHTKRIVFREITKSAIENAVNNPRIVDIDLVNAQQARRILDRLVGFELSETLWRKIRGKLSAGRVQSVAVKLIVEREREIQQFESEPYYRLTAIFTVKNQDGKTVELKAEYKDRFPVEKDAYTFLEKCINAQFDIRSIEKKPLKRNPAPPFTTSTLQQEASRKIYFSVNRTMQVAQKLYEQGHITYMRTDSTALSGQAIASISQAIKKEFGDRYLHVRKYKSKSGSQEAHEAIRPTYIENAEIDGTSDERKLYDLIWKRTIASQMAQAELEKTTVLIGISSIKDGFFEASGEVLQFDGFLRVYLESTDEEDEEEEIKGMLPPLHKGQALPLKVMEATQRYTRPPSRYTEAGLVKKLEELGIGRPSTYAPTITKIMEKDRGYVVKESRDGEEREYMVMTLKNNAIQKQVKTEMTGAVSNRLFAMDIGMVVTDFLNQHFVDIMDYKFTAEVEDRLDSIASGSEEWKKIVREFYDPFHKIIEHTIENADRAKGMRVLGIDPESKQTVLVQMTRYGPTVQIGTREEVGEEGKPRFANLKPGQSMETIAYDEAMDLFKLPRELGSYKEFDLVVNNGRYGPYIKYGDKFASLPKGMDPLELDLEEAKKIIDAKMKEDEPMGTYKGEPIQKGKGRFGPFLKWKDLYVNVPKKYDIENITLDEAHVLISQKVEKENNRYIQLWEKENIAIENGRWGPFFRVKKKAIAIPKKDGKKPDVDELKALSLDEVKKMIKEIDPKAI